jgi:hypothetical protein
MNTYEKVILHNGEITQKKKARQEFQEIINIINDDLTLVPLTSAEKISEIADGYNMLGQLVIMWNLNRVDIENEMVRKMQRILDVIEKERTGMKN